MMTMIETTRLITWVIVGLVVLANILYWFGPAALRTEELVVIGLLIIGRLVSSLAPPTRRMNAGTARQQFIHPAVAGDNPEPTEFYDSPT